MSDSCAFVDVERSLWREDGSVIYKGCWSSPAQSFSGPSPIVWLWKKNKLPKRPRIVQHGMHSSPKEWLLVSLNSNIKFHSSNS
jgi:hypothetical protein